MKENAIVVLKSLHAEINTLRLWHPLVVVLKMTLHYTVHALKDEIVTHCTILQQLQHIVYYLSFLITLNYSHFSIPVPIFLFAVFLT